MGFVSYFLLFFLYLKYLLLMDDIKLYCCYQRC